MLARPPAGSPPGSKKIIVEIGHGAQPIWRTLRKLPLGNQSYVGLDISAPVWPSKEMPLYDLERGRRKILERAGEGRDCRFIVIDDLGILPLPDAIASEVYLSLVTSDPRISPVIVERIVNEAARITMAGGHAVFDNGAVFSPDYGDVFVDFCRSKIIFKADRFAHDGRRDEDNAMTRLLNQDFTPMPAESYAIFLAERGYPAHFSRTMEPGKSITILERRDLARTGCSGLPDSP